MFGKVQDQLNAARGGSSSGSNGGGGSSSSKGLGGVGVEGPSKSSAFASSIGADGVVFTRGSDLLSDEEVSNSSSSSSRRRRSGVY